MSTRAFRAHRRLTASALAVTLAASIAACSSSDDKPAASGSSPSAAASSTSSDGATNDGSGTEQRKATPRLAVTHDGGVTVLDGTTLEVLKEIPATGYLRANRAGDERSVVVTTDKGFQVLDLGTWAEPHGDHSHYFTADPSMTDVTIEAKKPGHVVVHDGKTILFADGTGDITVTDSDQIRDKNAQRTTLHSEKAHHGVAVAQADGTVVHTLGDEKNRVGVVATDASGKEIARTENCPGVHGEAVAEKAMVFGCTNGAEVYRDGKFQHVTVPDTYGRTGNQAGSETSPITLGDYKVDKDAKLERPTRVNLIDSRTATSKLVTLPASYSFRSLGRGPRGEALVLGTDGHLRAIDPETAQVVKDVPVTGAWTESEDWHDPRPTLFVMGSTAYVSEPSAKKLTAVNLLDWTVGRSATLPDTPDEIAGASGDDPHKH